MYCIRSITDGMLSNEANRAVSRFLGLTIALTVSTDVQIVYEIQIHCATVSHVFVRGEGRDEPILAFDRRNRAPARRKRRRRGRRRRICK